MRARRGRGAGRNHPAPRRSQVRTYTCSSTQTTQIGVQRRSRPSGRLMAMCSSTAEQMEFSSSGDHLTITGKVLSCATGEWFPPIPGTHRPPQRWGDPHQGTIPVSSNNPLVGPSSGRVASRGRPGSVVDWFRDLQDLQVLALEPEKTSSTRVVALARQAGAVSLLPKALDLLPLALAL